VTTDASDYAPGSTAEITASGFGVGDDIKFTTQVIDPKTSTVSPVVWDVVDGSAADGDHEANGRVLTQFPVTSAYADTTIKLTATDTTTGQTASTIFTDSNATLSDWQDGPAGTAPGTAGSWTNGNLNAQKAHYAEGESVPFQTVLTGLTAGTTYSIILTWDTTKAGKHAFDYLTSYNYSWAPTNPQELTGFPNPLTGTPLASQFIVTQANPFAGASTLSINPDQNEDIAKSKSLTERR